jgi:hypothetical protein
VADTPGADHGLDGKPELRPVYGGPDLETESAPKTAREATDPHMPGELTQARLVGRPPEGATIKFAG